MKSKIKHKSEKKFKWNSYNFDYEKVMRFCDKQKKTSEKILYLEFVLKEKRNSSNAFDIDIYFSGASFEEKIKNEIRYLDKEMKLTNPYMAEGYDKIIWSRNRQDFAPIFDFLMRLGYISFRRNKWEMLCNHFVWSDGEMTPKQLKDALSNIIHNPETHQVSEEVSKLMKCLEKVRSS
jgi:hypothetical protein